MISTHPPRPFWIFGLEGDVRHPSSPLWVSKYADDICDLKPAAGFVLPTSYVVFVGDEQWHFEGKRHTIRQRVRSFVDPLDGPCYRHEPIWAVPMGIYTMELDHVVRRLRAASIEDREFRVKTERVARALLGIHTHFKKDPE